MFNPEKLLGGLIRSSTRGSRGGLGGLVSGGAALGVLGVAMEAVEHYMNQPKGTGALPKRLVCRRPCPGPSHRLHRFWGGPRLLRHRRPYRGNRCLCPRHRWPAIRPATRRR